MAPEQMTLEQIRKAIEIAKKSAVKPWPDGYYHFDENGKVMQPPEPDRNPQP